MEISVSRYSTTPLELLCHAWSSCLGGKPFLIPISNFPYGNFCLFPLSCHCVALSSFYWWTDLTLSSGIKQRKPQHCMKATNHQLHGGQRKALDPKIHSAVSKRTWNTAVCREQTKRHILRWWQGSCFIKIWCSTAGLLNVVTAERTFTYQWPKECLLEDIE